MIRFQSMTQFDSPAGGLAQTVGLVLNLESAISNSPRRPPVLTCIATGCWYSKRRPDHYIGRRALQILSAGFRVRVRPKQGPYDVVSISW
jgi:hypothetical protein